MAQLSTVTSQGLMFLLIDVNNGVILKTAKTDFFTDPPIDGSIIYDSINLAFIITKDDKWYFARFIFEATPSDPMTTDFLIKPDLAAA